MGWVKEEHMSYLSRYWQILTYINDYMASTLEVANVKT